MHGKMYKAGAIVLDTFDMTNIELKNPCNPQLLHGWMDLD